MFRQTWLKTAALLLFLAGLAAYAAFGGYFARELVIEIALLATVAVALDFVAGYGGMVSLCHGAIFGLGAYVYAGATVILEVPPAPSAALAIAAATLFGLVVGAVTSGISGIFFIMATLAFGQMLYVVFFRAEALGGDDGMSGVERFDLSAIGVDLGDSFQFALLALLLAALSYGLLARVLSSAFGRTLVGLHANEDRMRALGLEVWPKKALAFALSAAVAGAAGVVAAQHTQFVSPELLVWTVSGEAMVVVILGGLGTLVGPMIGAALFVLLRHEVSRFTDHWHLVVGLVLIAVIVVGGRGVFGALEDRLARRRSPPVRA